MYKRRILIWICSLLAAALCLEGCGIIILRDPVGETEESTQPAAPDTTAPPAETEEKKYRPADRTSEYQTYADAYLEQVASGGRYFDGQSFFVACPLGELIEGESTGTIYAQAVYRRNLALQEKLGIHLDAAVTDEASFYDLLSTAIRADEYFADLLLIPQNRLGVFAAGDALMNLRSVPMLDVSRPYFYADSVEAATAGNRIFAVAGYASLDHAALSAVYFNRDHLEKSGLALPYDAVLEGSWTWDMFFELCSSSAAEGIYSYTAQYTTDLLPTLVYASCGGKTVRSTPLASPAVALSEGDQAIFDRITRLYTDKARHTDPDSGVSAFHTGGALFMIDRLFLMSWMPGSTQNWGVLPLPKGDTEQEQYRTLADSSAPFFAVPANTVDSVMSSVVLSALNAASYGILNEAYAEYAAQHLLRDNESAAMLQIISASCTYDFALGFDSAVPALADATTKGLRDLAGGLSPSALLKRAALANQRLAERFPATGK